MMFKLFSQQQRQKAIDAIKQAPEHFIVHIKERTRSVDQNARLWALLSLASKNIPWVVNGQQVMLTPDEWKDVFTASLYEEKRLAKGIRGGFVLLGRSTSKMSVTKVTELMDFIESFLAENGVDDVQEQPFARSS